MKKLYASILFSFILQLSFGQIGFQENGVMGDTYTTLWPQVVRAADIDGDNDLDIIAFGLGLNWYENVDGFGNFGQKKIIDPRSNSRAGDALFPVDFDNDGDIDLIGRRSQQNTITLFENIDGLGNFEIKETFELGLNNNPLPFVPADMDNDGDLDILCFYIVVNGPFQGKLIWLENDGTGSFGDEQVLLTGNSLFRTTLVYADDLDGDNDMDIILGHFNQDKIAWLENTDGNNTYSAPVIITELADGITALYTSDIDNDGDRDIVSASEYDNEVAWYNNTDGLGSFSDEISITTSATETKTVVIADVNNDNTNDIVFTSVDGVGWLSNTNGLGNFGTEQFITDQAFGVRSIIMADLDGDGFDDLVSASNDDDKVAWYKNIDGTGNFGRQVGIARSFEYPYNVYPGDFDGDNDIDLLVNSQGDAKLSWYENVNGIGFYGKQHIITEDVGSNNSAPRAYPVDIDGDGDLDIASSQYSRLFWYENVDGQGNYLTQHTINDNEGATLIRAQDLDGDGDMDLVFSVYSENKIAWYENLDSNGTFGPERIISDPGGNNGSMTSLEIADMDGDNDMDIIASSYNGGIYYYENTDGLGNFTYLYMSIFDAMEAVYPADMDGDGDLDIVAVASNGGDSFPAVKWYINNGGIFNGQRNISTARIHGQAIYAADIDGDGDMDVVTASGHSQTLGKIEWYENKNGLGTQFETKIIHELFNYSIGHDIKVVDIDNDNDMDIVGLFNSFGNNALGKLSVFENLGDLGNTVHGTVWIDTNADGCTPEDLKGSHRMVIADNGVNSFATFTDTQGAYHIATTEGDFNATLETLSPTYFVSTPLAHTFNFTGMNNSYSANFCIEPVGTVNDLNINVYPSQNNPRPSVNTTYQLVYKNTGTTQLSGNVNFEFDDSKLNFLTASQSVTSQTANSLTFDYVNLNPFETRTIDLEFNIFAPPTTNIGDELIANATINPISGDETEEDNTFTLKQTVIGSYDPNDITCLEGDEILLADADKYLHYLIRFQNTGTASAINVKVENMLDTKLDWTTMQLESLSHTGRVEILNGSEVSFIFNNINLLDSTTDEPNSHGFIAYKIKPKTTVAVGDIFYNTADIFFDFNPAITTNTASTEIVETLSVADFQQNQVFYFPNPVKDKLRLKSNSQIESIEITDILGKVIFQNSYNSSDIEVDISDLKTSMYFVAIKVDGSQKVIKILKE